MQRRAVGPSQPAEGVVQRLAGQAAVQCGEGVAQATFQHHLAIVMVYGSPHLTGLRFASKPKASQVHLDSRVQPGGLSLPLLFL